MNLTNEQFLVVGCTIFNICIIFSLIIHCLIYNKCKMRCIRCTHGFSTSYTCKKCKYYRYSLAYYATKHPNRLKEIGTVDNYKKKINNGTNS